MRCTSIEQRWTCVREVPFGHEMVRLQNPLDIAAVNAYCNAHQHMLWAFGNTTVDFQEVRAFESLETKASERVTIKFNKSMVAHLQTVVKITIIDDSRIESFCIRDDNIMCFLRYHAGRPSVLRVDYQHSSMPCLRESRSTYHSCTGPR
jgi:hypothetical protein